jgi:hypothetical protein
MKPKKHKPADSPPSVRKKRKTRQAKAAPTNLKNQDVSQMTAFSGFPVLSSKNLAQLLNGFLVFRSTVKDLSQSLQKVENVIDSALGMFEIASRFNRQSSLGRSEPSPMLPPFNQEESQRIHQEDDDIPVIHPPAELENAEPDLPFPPFLKQIPLAQILALLQSPLVWRWLSELLKARKSTAAGPKTSAGQKRKLG